MPFESAKLGKIAKIYLMTSNFRENFEKIAGDERKISAVFLLNARKKEKNN